MGGITKSCIRGAKSAVFDSAIREVRPRRWKNERMTTSESRDLSRPSGRSIQLSATGQQARIIQDEHDDGWVLEVGGMIQSHVDLESPQRIRYEYLRRIANVLDTSWPARLPLSVLHLGAGALTLPRYLQVTRPGSAQTVIELERELTSLVISELPLPECADLEVIVGDARTMSLELAEQAKRFDAIILDIYTGLGEAEHLSEESFYTELLAMLNSSGVLLVNIGDDAGLLYFARQARLLESAATDAGFSGAWTLVDAGLLERRSAGNLILAAGDGMSVADPDELRSSLLARGPHPAAVLEPAETAAFATRLS